MIFEGAFVRCQDNPSEGSSGSTSHVIRESPPTKDWNSIVLYLAAEEGEAEAEEKEADGRRRRQRGRRNYSDCDVISILT